MAATNKRMLDSAVWESDKIARCHSSSKPEYLWLYLLADPYGNFEINTKAIHSRVYATTREEITEEDVKGFLADFERVGLLYTWTENNNKRYGHWVGSEKPGRLPSLSERAKYSKLPVRELYEYGNNKKKHEATVTDEGLAAYLKQTEEAFQGKQMALLIEKPKQEPEAVTLNPAVCSHCQKAFQEIVPISVFQSFMRMRAQEFKRKNRQDNPDSRDIFCRNLLLWHSEGQDVIEIIERAVRNSWMDLWPLKNENGNGTHKIAETRPVQFITSEFGPRRPRSAETQAAIEAVGKKFLEKS